MIVNSAHEFQILDGGNWRNIQVNFYDTYVLNPISSKEFEFSFDKEYLPLDKGKYKTKMNAAFEDYDNALTEDFYVSSESQAN